MGSGISSTGAGEVVSNWVFAGASGYGGGVAGSGSGTGVTAGAVVDKAVPDSAGWYTAK